MIKILAITDIEKGTDPPFFFSKRTKHEQHVTNCIIKRFGQFKPLLVEESQDDNFPGYSLIAGSSVYNALVELGISYAYCFVFKYLSVQDHVTIKMIDNQHRDLDVIKNAKLLEYMLEAGEVNYKALANVLHHTRDEIHNFKQLKEFNWQDFDNDPAHFQTSLF